VTISYPQATSRTANDQFGVSYVSLQLAAERIIGFEAILQQFAEKLTPFKGSYQPSAFSIAVLADG
jgi:hypothetical protein